MAKSEAATVYQLAAPEQKRWDKENGVWQVQPPYTAKRPVFGVQIINGKGQTDDPHIAQEFVDMGYIVTPSPAPALRAENLKKLQRKAATASKTEIDAFNKELAVYEQETEALAGG